MKEKDFKNKITASGNAFVGRFSRTLGKTNGKIDIDAVRLKIAELAKKRDFEVVALFGSQATGAIHKKSDIDIAVLRRGGVNYNDRMKLLDDFYEIFKREDIEIVDMSSASPTMMYVVVRDGKLLYEKESETFLKWKLYAIWVWLDTAWLRQLRDKKMVEWARTA